MELRNLLLPLTSIAELYTPNNIINDPIIKADVVARANGGYGARVCVPA
jgi:hypothetical protein